MEMKSISLRVDAALIDDVDELVRTEAQQIGLPVDRTGFIARAIRLDVERRKAMQPPSASNDNAKGAA